MTCSLRSPFKEGKAFLTVMIISEPGKLRPRRLYDWPKVTLLRRPEPGCESQCSHRFTVRCLPSWVSVSPSVQRRAGIRVRLATPRRADQSLAAGGPHWGLGSAASQPRDRGNRSDPRSLPLREVRALPEVAQSWLREVSVPNVPFTVIISVTSSWPSPPFVTLAPVGHASPAGLLAHPPPPQICPLPTASAPSQQTEATYLFACWTSLGLGAGRVWGGG